MGGVGSDYGQKIKFRGEGELVSMNNLTEWVPGKLNFRGWGRPQN